MRTLRAVKFQQMTHLFQKLREARFFPGRVVLLDDPRLCSLINGLKERGEGFAGFFLVNFYKFLKFLYSVLHRSLPAIIYYLLAERTSYSFFSSLCNWHRGNLAEIIKKRKPARLQQICYDISMIGSITGKVAFKSDKFLIIETAGVGYKVNVTPDLLSKAGSLGQELSLWIHTHVREDSLELYGFPEREELGFFEMLLGVSGIGPKSALALLGITTVETLRKAIGSGDTGYLTKVSGIGKKTAERIVIELRDKIDGAGSETLQGEMDALEALKSLGYSQSEARDALKRQPADLDTNTKVREALKVLGGK